MNEMDKIANDIRDALLYSFPVTADSEEYKKICSNVARLHGKEVVRHGTCVEGNRFMEVRDLAEPHAH